MSKRNGLRYKMNSNTSFTHIELNRVRVVGWEVCCTKSQSSLLTSSQWVSVLFTSATVRIPVHTTPECGTVIRARLAQRWFAPLEKSRRNHHSYVWKEALSGMVFVPTSRPIHNSVDIVLVLNERDPAFTMQFSLPVRESGKFLLVESGISGFGIRNTAQGIWNPTIWIRNPSSTDKK